MRNFVEELLTGAQVGIDTITTSVILGGYDVREKISDLHQKYLNYVKSDIHTSQQNVLMQALVNQHGQGLNKKEHFIEFQIDDLVGKIYTDLVADTMGARKMLLIKWLDVKSGNVIIKPVDWNQKNVDTFLDTFYSNPMAFSSATIDEKYLPLLGSFNFCSIPNKDLEKISARLIEVLTNKDLFEKVSAIDKDAVFDCINIKSEREFTLVSSKISKDSPFSTAITNTDDNIITLNVADKSVEVVCNTDNENLVANMIGQSTVSGSKPLEMVTPVHFDEPNVFTQNALKQVAVNQNQPGIVESNPASTIVGQQAMQPTEQAQMIPQQTYNPALNMQFSSMIPGMAVDFKEPIPNMEVEQMAPQQPYNPALNMQFSSMIPGMAVDFNAPTGEQYSVNPNANVVASGIATEYLGY